MAPKNPTNADIFKEVREIKEAQRDMNTRLTTLEARAIGEDAAKKAISEYKSSETATSKRKLITDIGTFLGVVTLLLWIVIQYFATRGK